jgi:hypothetical protein
MHSKTLLVTVIIHLVTFSIRTNYFYGPRAEYAVNGGVHNIPGSPLDSTFHKYTIDW